MNDIPHIRRFKTQRCIGYDGDLAWYYCEVVLADGREVTGYAAYRLLEYGICQWATMRPVLRWTWSQISCKR